MVKARVLFNAVSQALHAKLLSSTGGQGRATAIPSVSLHVVLQELHMLHVDPWEQPMHEQRKVINHV